VFSHLDEVNAATALQLVDAGHMAGLESKGLFPRRTVGQARCIPYHALAHKYKQCGAGGKINCAHDKEDFECPQSFAVGAVHRCERMESSATRAKAADDLGSTLRTKWTGIHADKIT